VGTRAGAALLPTGSGALRMINFLLGGAAVGLSGLGLWCVLPGADGKVQPWITPRLEPVVAIVLVLAATLGVGLIVAKNVEALT